MDWKALLRDRRFQLAAAATAAVGGYVWYARRKAAGGGGAAAGSGTATTGYQGAGTGGVDTTGTDVANWLGQFGGSLQNQLDAYSQSLSDAVTHLQQMPPSGTPSPAPAPAPTPPPPPPPPRAPAPPPSAAAPPPPASRPFVTVTPWSNSGAHAWSSYLLGISGHTGVSLAKLLALNPSIKNPNLIYDGQKIFIG